MNQYRQDFSFKLFNPVYFILLDTLANSSVHSAALLFPALKP
jgi:hypothetical protein